MPTSWRAKTKLAFAAMSQRPSATAMPTTPAGGASDAATSSPTAAPETRLLRSEVRRYSAPAAPATSGRMTATPETCASWAIRGDGESGPIRSVSTHAAAEVTKRAAK